MTELERAVEAIEGGLLTAIQIQGRPERSMSLAERMAYYRVPGVSIALVDGGKVASVQGYGVVEAGGDEGVTPETIFQAGSISKPVAAMVALALVEAGALDLDTDVNQVLRSWHVPENEYTAVEKVTLRRLLSHTAGLTVFGYAGYRAGAVLPTRQQILDGQAPATSEPVRVTQTPGEGFRYSGGGYVLLQQLIEDVTGRPLAELAEELIFDGLGMVHTSFDPLLPKALVPQAATAHWDNGEPVPGRWHTYPEGAPGCLWSTPSDLARLTIEVLKSHQGASAKVLSPTMTQTMLTPQTGWMGLGYVVVEQDDWIRFDHPGWNEGFHSYLAGFLGAGQGVVWMTNGENGKLLGHEVMRGLVRVMGWPGFRPTTKPVTEVDTSLLPGFVGEYTYVDAPQYGARITLDGEHLFLHKSPTGLCYLLYPESDTAWFCLERPEAVSFVRDDVGQIRGMRIGGRELTPQNQNSSSHISS